MTDIDPVDVAIGARIRARREELRITQAQLAAAAGVTFQQIQKYERGVNRIAAARLLLIAEALKTSGAALLGELEGEGADALALAQPGVAELLECFLTMPEDQRDAILLIARAVATGSALITEGKPKGFSSAIKLGGASDRYFHG